MPIYMVAIGGARPEPERLTRRRYLSSAVSALETDHRFSRREEFAIVVPTRNEYETHAMPKKQPGENGIEDLERATR